MRISNKIDSISPQTQTTLTLSVGEETISSVISLIIIINRLSGMELFFIELLFIELLFIKLDTFVDHFYFYYTQ